MKRTRKATIGTVSHGTMLPEDLIPAFLDELKYQGHSHGLGNISERMKRKGYFDSECAQEDLDDLFNRLDDFAPPFFYFGAHPGDGSDYGYWLCEEWQETLEEDGSISVADLSDVPADYFGYVAVINDHGNATLYNKGRNGRFYEIWSVV